MSEQQNRIAALLNSGSGAAVAPSTSAAPTPVAYDIPPGQDASNAQLGTDSTPDALISVDGHHVAAGDNGLSIDVAPDGSTHVSHGPQDGTQLGGVPNGQPPNLMNIQNLGQNGAQPPVGSAGAPNAPLAGDFTQSGMTQDPGQYGAQPTADGTTGSNSPMEGRITQSGMTQDPQTPGDGSQADTPIEHLHGHGPHAAQADLAVHGAGAHMPATVTHHNPDGSLDVTIPKGQDNPHAITVHVKPNDDGSLDLTVPKSATNPHEINVHVQPGKHVDLNITQDKDGHLKIDAHDHPPGQKGDWPGLKQPAGQGQQPGAGIPTPDMPKPPGGGGAPPGGGGGAPPGGGGGAPPGGGGGHTPVAPTVKPPKPPSAADSGYASIRQQSIRDLGKDIDSGPVQTMDKAHKDAAAVNVGYPGFGVAGAAGGLAGAHTEVRDAGAKQFLDGHTSLSKWVPNLKATATNWQGAEDSSTGTVNDVPH